MSRAVTAGDIRIRDARTDDLAEVASIYSHDVLTGLASFEETPPDAAEHLRRFELVRAQGLPYIVADVAGRVRGYAYAVPYRTRSAYRYAVEDSVYVDRETLRQGIAGALMTVLIKRCTDAGMRQMVAVIGDSANAASIGLHSQHGFRVAGTLPSVGYKLGRWVDSVIMTRPLGDGDTTDPAA